MLILYALSCSMLCHALPCYILYHAFYYVVLNIMPRFMLCHALYYIILRGTGKLHSISTFYGYSTLYNINIFYSNNTPRGSDMLHPLNRRLKLRLKLPD